MEDLLQKMKDAWQQEKQNNHPDIRLQDVVVNKQTGEFKFIIEQKK
ncbi:MAG: hypothetical protein KGZ63_08770 [Clostridiales bacterium]|nr:hypothetical protein [Clostridiales bacterium]